MGFYTEPNGGGERRERGSRLHWSPGYGEIFYRDTTFYMHYTPQVFDVEFFMRATTTIGWGNYTVWHTHDLIGTAQTESGTGKILLEDIPETPTREGYIFDSWFTLCSVITEAGSRPVFACNHKPVSQESAFDRSQHIFATWICEECENPENECICECEVCENLKIECECCELCEIPKDECFCCDDCEKPL
jgi:hypothetical protein